MNPSTSESSVANQSDSIAIPAEGRIKSSISDYELLKLLGQGTFG